MNRKTLLYYENVLLQDFYNLQSASDPGDEISDDDLKRALNVQLESIKADVANIQHLLET